MINQRWSPLGVKQTAVSAGCCVPRLTAWLRTCAHRYTGICPLDAHACRGKCVALKAGDRSADTVNYAQPTQIYPFFRSYHQLSLFSFIFILIQCPAWRSICLLSFPTAFIDVFHATISHQLRDAISAINPVLAAIVRELLKGLCPTPQGQHMSTGNNVGLHWCLYDNV